VAGQDLEPLTAEEAARQAAVTIPMLIASGCAFLDPMGYRRPASAGPGDPGRYRRKDQQ